MTNKEIALYHITKGLEFGEEYKNNVGRPQKEKYYAEYSGQVCMAYFLGLISEEEKNVYKQKMYDLLELDK